MIPGGNTSSAIRGLKIFYFASLFGVVLFAGIVLVMAKMSLPSSDLVKEYSDSLLIGAAVLAVICFAIARNVFARRVAAIRNTSVNIQGKLNLYRTALISYIGLCEAPALLGIILFLLTNNYWLLLVSGVMIMAMALKFPTREKLIADMSLDWKEQQELV
jgi:hypothetical protein